ncbi:hypothetical protein LSS_07994 [Leptospira santarosai serovar Shermani str. LT 821]|uniref:Uncharacterized protein n=1 Tax=Leptospira santarosai serovar Shermani str. LT 821 TaxID=758847 RepID=K8Y2Q5_9LEPT|nr:hypothetical protein LSS_07994 [Leptospira santarosai serovar Shermani str. LT 821]
MEETPVIDSHSLREQNQKIQGQDRINLFFWK